MGMVIAHCGHSFVVGAAAGAGFFVQRFTCCITRNTPNAAPMITPTARSTALPRMANSLNSFSTVFLLCFFDEGEWRPCANSPVLRGPSLRGLYPTREEKQRDRYGGRSMNGRRRKKYFSLAGREELSLRFRAAPELRLLPRALVLPRQRGRG